MEVTGIMGNLNKKNPGKALIFLLFSRKKKIYIYKKKGPGTYPNSSSLNKVSYSFR